MVSRESPDEADSLLPREERNSTADAFNGPSVSKAIGWKSQALARDEYFSTLLSAALSATEPAETEERERYEGAKVLVTVTSQARQRPEDHGIIIIRIILIIIIIIIIFKKIFSSVLSVPEDRC